MNKLFSFLGLDRRIRRLKIAAGEGALAIEDRAQLVRMAWEDEKERLKATLLLVIAVLGLTTVAVALLSVAVVVHFWETPYRTTAAWSVAAVWVALWVAAVIGLVTTLRGASDSFATTQKEFSRDWGWVQDRLSLGDDGSTPAAGTPRSRRPATREELLARIERQRQRVAVMQSAADEPPQPTAAPPADETPSQTALRLAKQHPVAAGIAAAAIVAVVRPKRLLRWAAFVAPVLWRMR